MLCFTASGRRRHGTKFNGAPYIIQRAGEAVYTEEGQKQTGEQIAYYMNNAKTILEGLKSAGYTVSGGVNAPYIWLKTPDKMTSWEFFDYLLEKANVVGTPGSGLDQAVKDTSDLQHLDLMRILLRHLRELRRYNFCEAYTTVVV